MKKPWKCANCSKMPYDKETQAKARAEEFEQEYGKPCRVYPCPFCPMFLITTKPRRGKHERSNCTTTDQT